MESKTESKSSESDSGFKYSPRGDEENSPRIISLLDDDYEDDEDQDVKGNSTRSQAKYELNTHSTAPNALSSPHRNMNVSLDLSNCHRADAKNASSSSTSQSSAEYMLEPAIQEKDVLIVFELPDGSQGEKVFKFGHTVELLKSFVEEEFGIPMLEQTLYLDDRKLDNPFSLLDYPEVKGCEEVFVRVEGNLPQFSKK